MRASDLLFLGPLPWLVRVSLGAWQVQSGQVPEGQTPFQELVAVYLFLVRPYSRVKSSRDAGALD